MFSALWKPAKLWNRITASPEQKRRRWQQQADRKLRLAKADAKIQQTRKAAARIKKGRAK